MNIPNRKSKEVSENYDVERNTFKRTVKDNPADRIAVEIGDINSDDFKPQAKIMRWDEVDFSLRRNRQYDQVRTSGKRIKAEAQDEEMHLYELDGFEDGGLEVELLLKTKPATNTFDFTIESTGLNFFYQPELTQEEKDNGAHRPDNVIGSYAVYHDSKRDNRVGGKEYKTGKAFHIYRPHITDADGNETWGELDITGNTLSVTVPQSFVDKAVYPVVVDPTFGYETIGGSREANDDITGSSFSAPEAGTLDSITVYGDDLDLVGPNVTCATYDDDNSDAFVANTEEITWTSGNAEWRTLNFSGSPSISSGTNYWLVAWADATGPGYKYDAGTTDQGGTDASGTYNTFPDPYSPTTLDRKYSIYATYTASTTASIKGITGITGATQINL